MCAPAFGRSRSIRSGSEDLQVPIRRGEADVHHRALRIVFPDFAVRDRVAESPGSGIQAEDFLDEVADLRGVAAERGLDFGMLDEELHAYGLRTRDRLVTADDQVSASPIFSAKGAVFHPGRRRSQAWTARRTSAAPFPSSPPGTAGGDAGGRPRPRAPG